MIKGVCQEKILINRRVKSLKSGGSEDGWKREFVTKAVRLKLVVRLRVGRFERVQKHTAESGRQSLCGESV
jgi:hypothetical protein